MLSSTITLVATALARWLGSSPSSSSSSSSTVAGSSSSSPSFPSSSLHLPEFSIGPLRITQTDIIQALERLSEEYNPSLSSSFLSTRSGDQGAKFSIPVSRSASVPKHHRTPSSTDGSRTAILHACATVLAYELIIDALRNLRTEYHQLCTRIQKAVTPQQDNHLQKLTKRMQRAKDTLNSTLITKYNLPSHDIHRCRQALLDSWSTHSFRMDFDSATNTTTQQSTGNRTTDTSLDTSSFFRSTTDGPNVSSITNDGYRVLDTTQTNHPYPHHHSLNGIETEEDSLHRSHLPSSSSSSSSSSSATVSYTNVSSLFPFPLPTAASSLDTSLDTAIHLLMKEEDTTHNPETEAFFTSLLPSSSSSLSSTPPSSSSPLYPSSIQLRLFANAAAKHVHSARNEVRAAALRVLEEVKQRYETVVTAAITHARENAIATTHRTWEDKFRTELSSLRTTEEEKYLRKTEEYQRSIDAERQQERRETAQTIQKLQEQCQRQIEDQRAIGQSESVTKIHDAVYEAKQGWDNDHQRYIDQLQTQHQLEIQSLTQAVRDSTIQELSQRAAEAHAKALAQAHQEYLQQSALQLDEIYAKHRAEIETLQGERDQLAQQLRDVIANCETAVQQRIETTLRDEREKWQATMDATVATLQREYDEQREAAVQNAKVTASNETEARVKLTMTSVVTRSRMEGRLEGEQKTEERLKKEWRTLQEEYERTRAVNEETIQRLRQEMENQRTETLRIQNEDNARRERLEAEVKAAASEVIDEADKRAQEKLTKVHQQELHDVCARLNASFKTAKTEWERQDATKDAQIRGMMETIERLEKVTEERSVVYRETVENVRSEYQGLRNEYEGISERYAQLMKEHEHVMLAMQEATQTLQILTAERTEWLRTKEFYETEKRLLTEEVEEKTQALASLSRTHEETLTKERDESTERTKNTEAMYMEKIATLERTALEHEKWALDDQAKTWEERYRNEMQRYADEVTQARKDVADAQEKVQEHEEAYKNLQQRYTDLQQQYTFHTVTNDERVTMETKLREEILTLRNECLIHQSKVTEYEKIIESYRADIDRLEESKETYEKERTEANATVQRLETAVAEALATNQGLTVTRDEALRHVREITVQLQGSERRVTEALNQQHRLQELVDTYENETKGSEERVRSLETTVQDRNEQIQEFRSTIDELRTEAEALRAERDSWDTKYRDSMQVQAKETEIRTELEKRYRTLEATYHDEVEQYKARLVAAASIVTVNPSPSLQDTAVQRTTVTVSQTAQTESTPVTVGTATDTIVVNDTAQQTETTDSESSLPSSSSSSLDDSSAILEALRTEYDNYKIRSASLLRNEEILRHDIQEQLKAVLANRRLHEKTAEQSIETLTKQINAWKTKYDTLQSTLHDVHQELEEQKHSQEELRHTAEEWRTDALHLTAERDMLRAKLRTAEEQYNRSRTDYENTREALHRSKEEYEQITVAYAQQQERAKEMQHQLENLRTKLQQQTNEHQVQLDQAITTTAQEHDTAWETAVRQITDELETVAEQLTFVTHNPTEFTHRLTQFLKEQENDQATGLSILIKTAMDSVTSAVCSHYTLQVSQMAERIDQTVKDATNQVQERLHNEWTEKLRQTENTYDEEIRTLTQAYEERLAKKDRLMDEYKAQETNTKNGTQGTIETLTKEIEQLRAQVTDHEKKYEQQTVRYETMLQEVREENGKLRTQAVQSTNRAGNTNEETPRVLRKVLETNPNNHQSSSLSSSNVLDMTKDQFWLSPEPQELKELSQSSSTVPSSAVKQSSSHYPNYSRRRDSLLRQSIERSPGDEENNPNATPYHRSTPSSSTTVSPDYLDTSASSPLGLNLLTTPGTNENITNGTNPFNIHELQTAITDRDQLLQSAQEEIGILYDRLAEAVITITALQQELSSQSILLQTIEPGQPSSLSIPHNVSSGSVSSTVTKIPPEILDESLQSINMARSRLGRSMNGNASGIFSVSKLDTGTASAQEVTLQQCTVLLTSLSQTVERVFNEADALVPHGSGAPLFKSSASVSNGSTDQKQADDNDPSDSLFSHESFLDTLNTSISELDANQAGYFDHQLELLQQKDTNGTGGARHNSRTKSSGNDTTAIVNANDQHSSMVQFTHTTRSLALGLIRMRTKASKLSSMLRHLRGGIAARLAAKDAVIDGLQRERLTYEMMLAQMRRTGVHGSNHPHPTGTHTVGK